MEDICEITLLEVSPLSEERLFRAWERRMPESRKRKIASLRFPEGQRLSLGVGILLWKALEKRMLDPRTPVGEMKYGKPYLPEEPGWHISLSHAGTWAMCAMGRRPVGCDLEEIRRGDLRLAERFYHPAERAWLAAFAREEDKKREFTRLWTRKESYLKLDGRGLGLELGSFDALQSGPGGWYEDGPAPEGYWAACCQGGENRPECVWRVIAAEELEIKE